MAFRGDARMYSDKLPSSMASQAKPLQFINISGPGITERGKTYLIRSHAAIWAHSGRRSKLRAKRASSLDSSNAICECLPETASRDTIIRDVPDSSCETCSGETVPSISTSMVLSGASPTSLLASGWQDPFDSLSLPYTAAESYMIDHYVRFLLPQFNIYSPEERSYPVFVQCMISKWVPFAFTDPGMMYGLFMLACRSLASLSKSVIFDQKALLYKARCIKSVKKALTSNEKSISDSTLVNILSLASDEFHNGSIDAAKNHTKAIRDMIKMRGGLKALGLDGLLRQLVLWNDGTAAFYNGKELTLTQSNLEAAAPFTRSLNPGFKDHMSLFSPATLTTLSDCCTISYTILAKNTNNFEALLFDQNTTLQLQDITARLLVHASLEKDPTLQSVTHHSSSQLEECLSLALLIYIKCVLSPQTHPIVTMNILPILNLAQLASRIRYLLAGAMRVGSWGAAMSLPERRMRGIWDLQLWMTVMAGLGIRNGATEARVGLLDDFVLVGSGVGLQEAGTGAVGSVEEDAKWTVSTASALLKTLGIESREEMEVCLGTFLEVGDALRVFAQEFWEMVSLDRSG